MKTLFFEFNITQYLLVTLIWFLDSMKFLVTRIGLYWNKIKVKLMKVKVNTLSISEVEKILGKRRAKKYFPNSEEVSSVDVLKALYSEGVRTISGRKLSKILGVTSTTLRKWAKENKIKCVVKSDKYWYDILSVLNYLGVRDVINVGDKHFTVISIITSSVPMGIGDIEENPEIVKKVLKEHRISHECVVKCSGWES